MQSEEDFSFPAFLTKPMHFEEIKDIPSKEEISRMSKEEKATYDIRRMKDDIHIDINRSKVLFKLGMIKRWKDKDLKAEAWEPYENIFAIENRNKFDKDDTVIMNTITRVIRVNLAGEIAKMHLISAVCGYLIAEGIQALQIEWMLDKFLKTPLRTHDDCIIGIELFWHN